jgi:hypothetical protein
MALSTVFVDAHIAHWQQQLSSPYYPHRKHWPTRLYHHAPLENALAILREGMLRSRNDFENSHPRDVAAPGIIATTAYAHDFVRLYFRPKTPTQFHIEGIRKLGECTYGEQTHAPILVMLGLESRAVLCRPNVQFSDKNMQLASAQTGDNETFFRTIPFEKVFSEGAIGGDRSLIEARCAEVLATSPIVLEDCLQEIYFRSEPERDTFLHALGDVRNKWVDKCIVSDALKLFEKKFAFVQEVSLTPKGLIFAFNERYDRRPLSVQIDAYTQHGARIISFQNEEMAARPQNANRWIIEKPLIGGVYLVRITVEGHLAYEAQISLVDVVF